MGQALYRKYRSKSLDAVVGQEHITDTLKQALKQGRISHAYLFTGPRGVGKTSVARIWAHEINGLPYDDDSAHLDIIEIDAASNRRIDEIRDLRDKVYIAPTSAKYKVYIIDEVHMLTREAFNALLKTLEEPPEHVVFILATTDVHKLPATIISRTQRYSFKPGEQQKVIAHLRSLAEQEGITISDEALALIAEHGEGSFRDSVSLLDQASSHGKDIDASDIEALLGLPPADSLENLLRLTLEGSASAELMRTLTQLYEQGFQASAIAKQLSQALRDKLLQGQATPQTLDLLGALVEVPTSHQPDRFLEISLLAVNPTSIATPHTTPSANIQAPQTESKQATDSVPAAATSPQTVPQTPDLASEAIQPPDAAPAAKEEPETTPLEESVATATTSTAVFDEALWPSLLQALKQKHNTLYSVARMGQPTFTDDKLRLAFAFPFHQKRINEASCRQLMSDIIKDLTGQDITIEVVVDKSATPSAPHIATKSAATVAPAATSISAISNIFGGAELLES